MKITPRQYAIVLYESIIGIKETELLTVINRFVRLLFEKKALDKIKEIIAEFEDYYNQAQGIIKVSIESATALKDAELKEVARALAEASGKKIELTDRVNADLISGIVIKIGDMVVDNSFKKYLQNLRSQLVFS